jgi:acyl-CoA reductase-like NAD-dependent aldehyde dehydrogenase
MKLIMAIETREQTAVLPILSHYINGTAVEVLPENTGPVTNPATGQVIVRVPRGGVAEVDAAVAAAKAAFPAWPR